MSSALALLWVGAQSRGEPASGWTRAELAILRSLSLESLPASPPDPSNRFADDPRAAALGRALFFDTRLSANGEVSCGSCHQPEKGFQDGLPLGRGLATVTRRTMPVVGAAGQQWLFWDGRKDSLWAQALGPLEDRAEHGMTRTEVVRLVARRHRRGYERTFGALPRLEGVPARASPLGDREARRAWARMPRRDRQAVSRAFANVGKAIAAYERRIRFGPARFDRYVAAALARDERRMRELLTGTEIEGLRLFVGEAHCLDCHNGPLLTNGEFHNTGVPPNPAVGVDAGRIAALARLRRDEFNCLGDFSDAAAGECAITFLVAESRRLRGAFKPPSLRNVTRRAPYMHAGQLSTLERVLRHYNTAPRARVGRTELHPLGLDHAGLAALEAFLRTLESPVLAP